MASEDPIEECHEEEFPDLFGKLQEELFQEVKDARLKWKEENFAKHYGMKGKISDAVLKHLPQPPGDITRVPKDKRTDLWKEFMAMKVKLSQIKAITEEIQVAGVRGDTDFHKLAMHAIFKITHE